MCVPVKAEVTNPLWGEKSVKKVTVAIITHQSQPLFLLKVAAAAAVNRNLRQHGAAPRAVVRGWGSGVRAPRCRIWFIVQFVRESREWELFDTVTLCPTLGRTGNMCVKIAKELIIFLLVKLFHERLKEWSFAVQCKGKQNHTHNCHTLIKSILSHSKQFYWAAHVVVVRGHPWRTFWPNRPLFHDPLPLRVHTSFMDGP